MFDLVEGESLLVGSAHGVSSEYVGSGPGQVDEGDVLVLQNHTRARRREHVHAKLPEGTEMAVKQLAHLNNYCQLTGK